MNTLFWMDAPKTTDFNWAIERVQRCESIIKKVAEKIIQTDRCVILDLGFSEKKQRSEFANWASANHFTFELHYLDIPKDIRWKRVQERNKNLNSQSVPVDLKTFEWMENYFEPPTSDEKPKIINES
jgi:predicted kinase